MLEPTDMELKILAIVALYIDDHGFSPSEDEINLALGKCKSFCQHHLLKLERLGLIKRARGVARSMSITNLGLGALSGMARK